MVIYEYLIYFFKCKYIVRYPQRGVGQWGQAECEVYLVIPGLVATPLQQTLFNSDGAGLQRGVRELEVRLRRRARALRALGRATTGASS